MRILLQSRSNLFAKRGGDTLQILNLQKGLQSLGCDVEISLGISEKLSGFDLVHCFNLSRIQETYLQIVNARNQGKRVVLTPVFHNLTHYNQCGRYGLTGQFLSLLSYEAIEQVRNFYLWLKKECPAKACQAFFRSGYFKLATRALAHVDALICAGNAELQEIRHFFHPEFLPPVKILPVGIDKGELDCIDDIFFKKTGLRNYILCVGRIEDLKNQLGLIKALDNYIIPLVFIGQANTHHRAYVRYFSSIIKSQPHLHWFENLSRAVVLSAIKNAKVHVLASFVETTGVANLEAAYFGVNVVSTRCGYAESVFGDYAQYCEPENPVSVREAILRALRSPVREGLRKKIVQNCSLKEVASRHLNFYEEVLGNHFSSRVVKIVV
jgi:glycosyltransferase involved in cell wall biosynthesis